MVGQDTWRIFMDKLLEELRDVIQRIEEETGNQVWYRNSEGDYELVTGAVIEEGAIVLVRE